MLPADIAGEADYRAYVRHLLDEESLNFHPDNAFVEYIDGKTKKRAYSWDEAAEREHLLGQAFDALGGDAVYRISLEEFMRGRPATTAAERAAQFGDTSVGDEIYAVTGGRRLGPGIVEEIYDDGTMRVDFTRQMQGRMKIWPQQIVFVGGE